jgi:hypothetical protein
MIHHSTFGHVFIEEMFQLVKVMLSYKHHAIQYNGWSVAINSTFTYHVFKWYYAIGVMALWIALIINITYDKGKVQMRNGRL